MALGLLLVLVGCRKGAAVAPLRVAAAADLQAALGEAVPAFTRETGRPVVVSFGSSGLLRQQIRQGAPFDLFLSAAAEYVDGLIVEGRAAQDTRLRYGRGRLVVYVPPGSGAGPLARFADLAAPTVRRVALANPEHAPYGRAAVQALRAAGLYEALRDRLVYAENVRQALQFAESGNVEAALVAAALVPEAAGGLPVPAALHQPIDQVLVVIRGGDEAGARAFAAWLTGPRGAQILRRHGLGLDGAP